LISVLSNHRSRGRKKVQQEEEKQSKRAAEAENKFRKLFLNEFGTLDCAQIKRNRETGWGEMDGVVGTTVRFLERVLTKERP